MNKMMWEWTSEEATRDDVLECVGAGWRNLLDRLIDDLFVLGWDGVVAQVKEKFGGLRFYIGSGDSKIWDRIQEAENESYRTCEDCGDLGKPRRGGWIKTLCDKCVGSP